MHQVPRKAWGAYSEGCVFRWKQFCVWKIPRGTWSVASHPAQCYFSCVVWSVRSSPSASAPHPGHGCESYVLQYAGRKRTDLTLGTQQLHSTSALIQPCPVLDNSLHFLHLTWLWSSWPWSRIGVRDTNKSCSREPWICCSTRNRLIGGPLPSQHLSLLSCSRHLRCGLPAPLLSTGRCGWGGTIHLWANNSLRGNLAPALLLTLSADLPLTSCPSL